MCAMRLVVPALFIAVGGWVAPAAASTLIPHRAVYDLALDTASDRSGITGLDGRMVYEFTGSACEGYTVKFRFVTQIDTSEASRITDQQSTTYEDGAGQTFSFSTRAFVDETLDKELKGTARASPQSTEISLEKPDTKTLELEATQFPTQHLIELLGKIEAGETFYETTLFDGSDSADKVMTTTVVIGRAAATAADDPEREAIEPLQEDPFWPVDIAYFDLGASHADGEEMPVYRISFKLHESGVSRDLVIDYGDFSMNGRLVGLSMFDKPADCAQQ